MILEQPVLGSDPSNGSGRERGAIIIRLDHQWNVMFHHKIDIFAGYMWLIGFQLLNASLVMMV